MTSAVRIATPFPTFFDTSGEPLESGFIYVGAANTNPLIESNRVQLYADPSLLIPIAQGVRTSGGNPVNSGTPVAIYVSALDYSIVVLNKNLELVYSSLTNPPNNAIYDTSYLETFFGVVPLSPQYPVGNILRYMTPAQILDVQSRARTLNVASVFATALSCNYQVWCPDGDYRTDTMVTVPSGKMLSLSQGAMILRAAGAAATTPVIYLQGYRSAFDGGQLATEKASPGGVIALGHLDNTTNDSTTDWRFSNCKVTGVAAAGNIGAFVPSGQTTIGPTSVNYFGTIENVHFQSFDVGLQFTEFANAHNATNLHFWSCRTACLELRGAYANNVSSFFCHQGAANGVIAVKISAKVIGTQDSSFNRVENFTTETGGAADLFCLIVAAASANTVKGNSNVAGGWSVSNINNYVEVSGILRYCTDIQVDAAEIFGKAVFAAARTGVTRQGFIKSYNTPDATPIAPNADLTISDTIASGVLLIRNASDGGSAVVRVDSVDGCVSISANALFSIGGADPGAGSSKLWVTNTGTTFKIRNRYAASKHIDVMPLAAAG